MLFRVEDNLQSAVDDSINTIINTIIKMGYSLVVEKNISKACPAGPTASSEALLYIQ
jgi:hypothetical protein